VWAAASYPDGTNPQTPNTALSVAAAADPFRTAGALDTNTETWTGGLTYLYHIDIPISDGADCYPTVRVYVAKASATIYFDSELVVL
jgi:hypothetical protein